MGAMTLWSRLDFQKNYDELESEISGRKFEISCSAEGDVVPEMSDRNCLEVGGYRVLRQGITTTIFVVNDRGDPEAIYRSGFEHGFRSSSLWHAVRVFKADQKHADQVSH